jgi:single-strand DNA-binding protein
MNNLTIAGQLGKDSELRATNSDENVLTFSVADSQGKDRDSIWWNCSLFGKRALSLQQYLSKGQAVTVSGSVTQRKYTDKQGVERTSFDMRVNEVALQGGRRQEEAPSQAPRQAAPSRAPTKGFDDMDSGIPF